MRHHGFTLIELIVILVLIGILSVYVSMKSTDFTAYSAAEELMQALEHAQQISMTATGGAHAGVQLQSDGFSFINTTAPAVQWTLLQPNPNYSVTISPTGSITFNGRGTPTCTGAISCATGQQQITVNANGESSSFAIEAYTGLVHR
ncbi:MAG: type II secretion system GspH family protein [Gammaproteobacteria bacterium]|nr:type II secretion system GspH family protein [Gammaproteobacteria bacterium]MCW8928020.1 type II secretion system GspH family protein [Gammaproteobacteria bacterium]MCW8959419.1 type II secretion system GspH family protein [Gammaproteobacteria bacterium]MCW8971969.1 type II secretion system GspH family protein [Gammaproteobacteria bacterium]MCW8991991.1 type II secretion system GspH family protein [Gammaproteobacteria bacterium]